MAVPNWMLGRVIGTCTITGQANSEGTLSDSGTVHSMLLTMTDFRVRSNANLAQASLYTSARQHNVKVDAGTSIQIDGFMRTNDTVTAGTTTNPARFLAFNFDIVKVIYTIGGVTGTYYGTIESYEEGGDKGVWTCSLTIAPVDNGAANPAFTV